MCKVQMLRALVKQRLTAAAEEIFGLFERTIAEYEEQLCRSKEENERQRQLLELRAGPEINRADVRKVSESKEEVPPEQQEWSSSVDQEDPEPPHIKEEEEELWSSQEGEQLQGLEEADITKFTFTPVPVKSEDDEGKPQSEGHHCGGPGPGPGPRPLRPGPGGGDLPVPGGQLPVPGGVRPVLGGGVRPVLGGGGVRPVLGGGGVPPVLGGGGVRPVLGGGGVPVPRDSSEPGTDDETRDPVVAEIEVSVNDWKETREPQLGLNSLGNNDVPVSHLKRFSCSECGKSFGLKATLKKHLRTHTGEKPFSCIVCEKSFTQRGSLQLHLQIHTGEKPFGCVICDFKCRRKSYLQKHMRTHTGEKPFSCSVCGQRFTWSQQAKRHTCANRQPSQLHQIQPEQSRVAEPLDGTSADGNRS